MRPGPTPEHIPEYLPCRGATLRACAPRARPYQNVTSSEARLTRGETMPVTRLKVVPVR